MQNGHGQIERRFGVGRVESPGFRRMPVDMQMRVQGGLHIRHGAAHLHEHAVGMPAGHGEAVGLGCAQAFRFSAKLGLCSSQDARRAERAIAASGLPARVDQLAAGPFAADRLVAHMAQDKKAEGGEAADADTEAPAEPGDDVAPAEPIAEAVSTEAPAAAEKPKRKRAPRKTKAAVANEEAAPAAAPETVSEAPAALEGEAATAETAKPAPKKRASRSKKALAVEAASEAETAAAAEPEPGVAGEAPVGEAPDDLMPDGEPRRGWWQRTFGN